MGCPNCGYESFPNASGGCDGGCGHSEKATLVFVRGDGVDIPIGKVSLNVTQAWARRFLGDDGRVWYPDGQFTVSPSGADWKLVHNAGATNETLVDGKAVRETTLLPGMIVSVGRERTGVSRTPLVVKLVRN